jgi:molybdopterin-guanine dinucleotide biosynthesis protein A
MKSAVILAGGKSSRMGVDKCTVLYHGKPLIHWPYNVLVDITDEVIISVSMKKKTSSLLKFFEGNVKIARDKKPDLGPISGLLSSFEKAKSDYIAVSPCDSPLIKRELYLRLFDLAMEADGAVPYVNGFWEPLHGVYKRSVMITAINKILSEGKNRPIDTYEYMNIKKLTEDDIMDFDPNMFSFVNVNSFQDLLWASGILKKEKI